VSFESELKSHLQSDSTIYNLVSSRIHPIVMPQNGTLPAITYHIVIGQPENSLDGFDSGLINYQLQIDCWATLHSQMLSLGNAVKERLKTNAANIKFVINDYPGFDDYESDTKRYRRSLTVSCWHRE
jgi:hypothetical protein